MIIHLKSDLSDIEYAPSDLLSIAVRNTPHRYGNPRVIWDYGMTLILILTLLFATLSN